MPTEREFYGNGVLIVVVGVTPHQGERENRLHGKVEQVIGCNRNQEVREMRIAEMILYIIREFLTYKITGKLIEIEKLTISLEGGCWKSAILVTRWLPTLRHVRI